MRTTRIPALLLLIGFAGCARSAVTSSPTPRVDPRLEQIVGQYVGLWRRATLDQWERLFLPNFTAAHTSADGSATVRTREQFFDAQRRYHLRVPDLREDLENVRIEQHGRLASVWADFVVTDSDQRNRGKLVLLIIEDRGEYKIHSLMFAYDR